MIFHHLFDIVFYRTFELDVGVKGGSRVVQIRVKKKK